MHLEHVRAGTGEPLVLLHGIGDSGRHWSPVVALLAPERDCWVVDLPGFGRTPPLRDRDPAPAALADAVVEFMRSRGLDGFHVAGNSLGGAVALEMGCSGHARSVCAIAPIGFAEGRELRLLDIALRATRRAAELALPHLDRVPLPAPLRRLALAHLLHRGERMPPGELAGALRDLALAPGFHTTLPHLLAHRFDGRPSCPVTVAWGEHDRLTLFRPQSARARARLREATHVTLAGCGHLATWDDPERVARVLLEASAAGS